MKSEDYPTLYIECCASAEHNQKHHFQLLTTRISLLVAIAVLGGISWKQFPSLGIIPPLAIAGSLSILFIFTIMLENRKYEKNWQLSRAVAETIKRETWLYMMKIDPYHSQNNQSTRDDFMEFLKGIIGKKALPWTELTHNYEGAQITETMDKKRKADFEEQKQFYIQDRINDQRSWYARKAKINSTKEFRVTMLMWILLAFGVTLAFVNVISSTIPVDLPINAVGIATTSSAAVLSWIGARSYKELSQTYSIAAHELSLIQDNAKKASTEDQLTKAVKEAEDIMSQEHKLWKTKRQIA